MTSFIEKSGTGIEKSGTGIEKSGTGIERSGTGIEKSGTGIQMRGLAIAVALSVATFGTSTVMANNDQLLISHQKNHLSISVHGPDGVIIGAAPTSTVSVDYQVIPLFSALRFSEVGSFIQPLVVGSGTGAASEVVGSGTGSSKQVVGSGTGASTQVVGSGTGASTNVVGSGTGAAGQVVGSGTGGVDTFCDIGAGFLVVGSGTGSASEVVGSGTGSAKDVVGSGTGSATQVVGSGTGSAGQVVGSGTGGAGQSLGACSIQPWGFAEVVTDADGAHVIVHKVVDAGLEEHLVAFVAAKTPNLAGGSGAIFPADGTWSHDFIATP
ncbi:MAG: hypothetical protein V2J42_03615 [Wenzhouxiangella sp.]|jgi:hypothetical protein|nr:hypothetical protein [Wenzhouxiangella sp.]